MTRKSIRADILKLLYEEDAGGLSQGLDCDDLSSRMNLHSEQVKRELNYLEQKGYVFLKSREIGGRIFSTLHITAEGIDVVEGKSESESIGHIEGDFVQIKVGNGARNLALGKDIKQYQESTIGYVPIERLDSALQEFLNYLDEDGKSRIDNLQLEVLRQEIDELRSLLRTIVSS